MDENPVYVTIPHLCPEWHPERTPYVPCDSVADDAARLIVREYERVKGKSVTMLLGAKDLRQKVDLNRREGRAADWRPALARTVAKDVRNGLRPIVLDVHSYPGTASFGSGLLSDWTTRTAVILDDSYFLSGSTAPGAAVGAIADYSLSLYTWMSMADSGMRIAAPKETIAVLQGGHNDIQDTVRRAGAASTLVEFNEHAPPERLATAARAVGRWLARGVW